MNKTSLVVMVFLFSSGLLLNGKDDSPSDLDWEIVHNLGLGSHEFNMKANYTKAIVPIFEKYSIKTEEERAEILIGIYQNKEYFGELTSPSIVGTAILTRLYFVDTTIIEKFFKEVILSTNLDEHMSSKLITSALKGYMDRLKVPYDDFLRLQIESSQTFKIPHLRRMFYFYLREYLKTSDDRQGRAEIEAVYRDLVLDEEDEKVFLLVDESFSNISSDYKYSRERYDKIKEFLAREERKAAWADVWDRLEQAEQELRPRFSE